MKPVCTDDFGSEVFQTNRAASRFLPAEEVAAVRSYVPGVKMTFAAAKDYDIRAEVRAFHEAEANCNTCLSLSRVKHAKAGDGLLYGRCLDPQRDIEGHPYRHLETEGVMAFSPDDWMGMDCHKPRGQRTQQEAS